VMNDRLLWNFYKMFDILLSAKVGIFSQSYAVILSFISCFSTFYCLDPYKIFFNILVRFIA